MALQCRFEAYKRKPAKRPVEDRRNPSDRLF